MTRILPCQLVKEMPRLLCKFVIDKKLQPSGPYTFILRYKENKNIIAISHGGPLWHVGWIASFCQGGGMSGPLRSDQNLYLALSEFLTDVAAKEIRHG